MPLTYEQAETALGRFRTQFPMYDRYDDVTLSERLARRYPVYRELADTLRPVNLTLPDRGDLDLTLIDFARQNPDVEFNYQHLNSPTAPGPGSQAAAQAQDVAARLAAGEESNEAALLRLRYADLARVDARQSRQQLDRTILDEAAATQVPTVVQPVQERLQAGDVAGAQALIVEARSQRAAQDRQRATDAFVRNVPYGVRPIASGAVQGLLSTAGIAGRLGGGPETAAEFQQARDMMADARRRIYGDDRLARALEGGTASLVQLALSRGIPGGTGRLTGALPAISVFTATATNDALTEGEAAGLTGNDLANYAVKQGATEAFVTALFSMIGAGGLENAALKTGAKATLRESLRQFGVQSIGELSEETLIHILNQYHRKTSGIDPAAIDFTTEAGRAKLLDELKDVAATTLVTMGASHAPSLLHSGMSRQQQVDDVLPDDVIRDLERRDLLRGVLQGTLPGTQQEQEMVGETGVSLPRTAQEAQWTGQQAAEMTPTERDQFFGTGTREATIREEAAFGPRRTDRPEQSTFYRTLEEGVAGPQTAQEAQFTGLPSEGPQARAARRRPPSRAYPEGFDERSFFAEPTGPAAEPSVLQNEIDQLTQNLIAAQTEARTDELTGLGNARQYQETLKSFKQRTDQTGRPFSVILFDAANLRSANELLGHGGADVILRDVGDKLRQATGRAPDAIVTRQGGDEFAVILPDTGKEGAAVVRSKIEEVVGAEPIVPGLSMFLAGEIATYTKGGKLTALLRAADAGVQARKQIRKKQLGEPLTRQEALARVAEFKAEAKVQVAERRQQTEPAPPPKTGLSIAPIVVEKPGFVTRMLDKIRAAKRGAPVERGLRNRADRIALIVSRWHRAKIGKAQQHVVNWQKALTESELQDLGAAVEGIGRIDKPDDTIKDVQARITPKGREVLATYRQAQEQARQEVNQYLEGIGLDEYIKFLPNYLAHFYADSPGKLRQFSSRWAKSSPSAKKRKLPTFKDAADAGLTPLTQNIAELHQRWAAINWRVATNLVFIAEMNKLVTSDNEPVLAPRGAAPDAWVSIDHPAFAKVWGSKDSKTGKVVLWRGVAAAHPDVAPALKSMLDEPFRSPWIKGVEKLNHYAKKAALSLSLFHHAALTESAQAVLAGTNPLKGIMVVGKTEGQDAILSQPHRRGVELMQDPEFLDYALMRGLTIEPTEDVFVHEIARDLLKLEAKLRNIPLLGQAVKRVRQFNTAWDKALWTHYHSGLKAYAFHEMVQQELGRSGDADPDQVAETVAEYINDAFGGQEWQNTVFRHPKVRQVMHWAFLAPDWTFSNLKIAGQTVVSVRDPIRRRLQIRYWRNMIPTLAGSAIAMQAAIFLAFGDEEEGDKQFPWENEEGKTWDIDVTPIRRKMPWYDPKDKQRYYVKFGKQAREVLNWIENPVRTARVKTSPVIQVAYEQLTGSSGDGFDLPFAEKPFYNGLGDRAKVVAGKFVPFSWRGNNFAFTAPMSKGATPWKLRKAFTKELQLYAEDSLLPIARKHPEFERELERLVERTFDAAKRNGHDGPKIFKNALSSLRGYYYKPFLAAIEQGDMKAAEKWGRALVRLHAGANEIMRSADRRGIEFDREMQRDMHQIMKAALEVRRGQ